MKRFETEHSPSDALDKSLILLEDIVQIFDLLDSDGLSRIGEFEDHIHSFQPREIGAAFVDSDAVGDTVVANRTPEEAPRGRLPI